MSVPASKFAFDFSSAIFSFVKWKILSTNFDSKHSSEEPWFCDSVFMKGKRIGISISLGNQR